MRVASMSDGLCAHARGSRWMRYMASMSARVGRRNDSRAVSHRSLSTKCSPTLGIFSSLAGRRSHSSLAGEPCSTRSRWADAGVSTSSVVLIEFHYECLSSARPRTRPATPNDGPSHKLVGL